MSQLHSLYSVFIMCVTFVNLAEHFVNLWTCRGFRSLTRDCPAVKLFSKHMKVEEQVVSIASIFYFSIGYLYLIVVMRKKVLV